MVDSEKIGRAIRTLREKNGLTQKGLAERLFISPVAVSKWERGISVPDVTCLQKLAVILDTDVEGILDGTATFSDQHRTGVLLLNDCRADTAVFDKPAIDYLLSLFLLAGLRHITVCCDTDNMRYISERFDGGKAVGVELSFCEKTDSFSDYLCRLNSKAKIMLMYKPVFIYGVDLTRFLQKMLYGSCELAQLSIVKRNNYPEDSTQRPHGLLPLAFFEPDAIITAAVENFSDLTGFFDNFPAVAIEPMLKGFVDFCLDSKKEITKASTLIEIIQEATGYLVNCPFEIAWRRGMISREQLLDYAQETRESKMSEYLLELCSEVN